MKFLLKVLLLLTVFLTPLIGAFGNFGYEQAKVLFFIVFISLIGFLWLIHLMKNPRFKWSGISKVAGLLIVILFITSLMGNNPTQSILGTQPYFQGWILYVYLFLFFLMVSWSKIKLEYWAYVLVGSATLVGLLAMGDWIQINLLGHQLPTYAGRVVSTFGQPNFYAGFLLLTLPFSYFLLKNQDKRLQLLGWGSGIISYLGIITSYSRSAILLSLVLLILGLVDQLKIKLKFIIVIIFILILSILTSLVTSSGFFWKEFLQPLAANDPDLTKESVENRLYIWPQALKVSLERPIFGYGLENISLAFADYFSKYKHPIFEENLKISPVLISLKDLNLDRSHNYIFDLLLFSGISGLLSWLILIVTLFIKLTQKYDDRRKNVLLISLIVYLIWIQFQNQSVVHLIYFWLLAGLVDRNKTYS